MRTKLGVLGLCAVVLGMMAMSTSAAQGATLSWLILNSAGTTATELLASLFGEKDSEHLILLTKIVKLMISVTCNNFALTNTNITGVGQVEAGGQVTFTGCAVYKVAPLGEKLCDVKTAGQANGTILSNKGKGKLVLHTFQIDEPKLGEKIELKEVLTEIAPEVAGPFATLLFTGETCALPEENPVNGSLFLKDCEALVDAEKKPLPCDKNALVHSVKHLVEQGPLTSLFVGADTAEHLETSLIGSGWIKLSGAHAGLKWAAMDA